MSASKYLKIMQALYKIPIKKSRKSDPVLKKKFPEGELAKNRVVANFATTTQHGVIKGFVGARAARLHINRYHTVSTSYLGMIVSRVTIVRFSD